VSLPLEVLAGGHVLHSEAVGLTSAVAVELTWPDGDAFTLTELVFFVTEWLGEAAALELTHWVPSDCSLAVALIRDLVETTGVAVSVAVAASLVDGLALVESPVLGVTDGLMLVGGVVSGLDGVVCRGVEGVELGVAVFGDVAGLDAAELTGGHTVGVGAADVTGVVPCPSAPAEPLLTG